MSANALGNYPVLDLTFKNYGVTDIAAGVGVLADTAHLGDESNAPGIVVPTASGGIVGTLGVTVTPIPAGGTGRVRLAGVSTCIADGTVTFGTAVQISDTASHLGQVKTCGAGLVQLGIAVTGATDGLPVNILHSIARNA